MSLEGTTHAVETASEDVGMNSSEDSIDEEYFYDYYDSMAYLPLSELIPVSIIYGLTFILGAAGNSLVIVCVARFRRMHNVTNILLVSLASADLLLVSVCVPIKFAKWFTFTWIFGEFLCKSVHYIQNVSVICSVLTLTLISLERYYAILDPMHARYICTSSRAKKLVICVWVASFCLAVPILFGQILKKVGEERVAFWCMKEWPMAVQEQIYEVGMLILVLIFPVCVMTFTYSSICFELWTVLSNRSNIRARSQFQQKVDVRKVDSGCRKGALNQGQVDDQNTRQQVIKMLVAIVALFCLCWAPTLIDNVLISFGILDRLHYGRLKYLRQAFALMSYANSCVNPIVYALMSKNFRNGFKNALCACALRDQRTRSRRGGALQASFQGRGVNSMGSCSRSLACSFEMGSGAGRRKTLRTEVFYDGVDVAPKRNVEVVETYFYENNKNTRPTCKLLINKQETVHRH